MHKTKREESIMKVDIKKFKPCREGMKYYENKASFKEAWNDCERGDWMLWMASRLGVDDRTLTRAKALCANTVRHLMTDKRSTDAIDAALRYAAGEISREELNEYKVAAHDAHTDAYAAYEARAAFSTTYAAYCAACDACDAYVSGIASYADAVAASDASAAASAASYAASAAASAAASVASDAAAAASDAAAYFDAKKSNLLTTAQICREVLNKAVFDKINIKD